jgi:2-methoxy-6-polyprenyl-1,4-benzoquinol methylase
MMLSARNFTRKLSPSSVRFYSQKPVVAPTPPKNDKETHFGYQTVPEQLKESMVGQVFANVASKYDVMNDVMSLGVHRLWKSHFINKLGPSPTFRLLDVAGGTGDIAFRFLDHIKSQHGALGDAHVTVLDINPAMLKVGQARAPEFGYGPESGHIDWFEGNAEQLSQIADESMDAYTIAFGIRNCTHIDQVLKQAYRVLKPGGKFMCLEFSNVETPLVKQYVSVCSVKRLIVVEFTICIHLK